MQCLQIKLKVPTTTITNAVAPTAQGVDDNAVNHQQIVSLAVNQSGSELVRAQLRAPAPKQCVLL